jgi:hypothetical protein
MPAGGSSWWRAEGPRWCRCGDLDCGEVDYDWVVGEGEEGHRLYHHQLWHHRSPPHHLDGAKEVVWLDLVRAGWGCWHDA